MRIGTMAFLAGVVLAAVVGFWIGFNPPGYPANLLQELAPWVVAGLGVLTGFLNIKAQEIRSFLIAGIALTVALISIQDQFYNPEWLRAVVFFDKVFITHAVLLVGFIAFFKTAKD